MSSSKKLTCLTIEQKLAVLKQLKTKKRNDVAKEFGCNPTTIGRIIKGEAKIRKIAARNGNLKTMRKRKSSYGDLNAAVSKWFCEQRAKAVPISGPLIIEKAAVLAQLMEIDFQVFAIFLN